MVPCYAARELATITIQHHPGGCTPPPPALLRLSSLLSPGQLRPGSGSLPTDPRVIYQLGLVAAWRGSGERPFLLDSVWDLTHLVDLLVARPDVDAARVGITGEAGEAAARGWLRASPAPGGGRRRGLPRECECELRARTAGGVWQPGGCEQMLLARRARAALPRGEGGRGVPGMGQKATFRVSRCWKREEAGLAPCLTHLRAPHGNLSRPAPWPSHSHAEPRPPPTTNPPTPAPPAHAGVSLGGMHAWLAAAADERIAAAAPVIGVQSFEWTVDHDAWHG